MATGVFDVSSGWRQVPRSAGSHLIDYLDFASPVSGLGSKMGMDATNKWPGETNREWGRTMQMTPEVTAKVDQMWKTLGL